jgi:hypothetical protein
MASKHSSRLVIPSRVGKDSTGKETKTSDLFQFMERVTDYETSKRHEVSIAVQQNNLALLNIGWTKVERPAVTWSGTTRRTPRVIIDTRDEIPQPNRPLALKLHEGEVARTAKRFSKIKVNPRNAADPTSRAAARISNNVLKDMLFGEDGIRWVFTHRDFWDSDYRHGLGILKAYQLWDHGDKVPYPLTTAMKCAGKSGVETKTRPMTDEVGMPVLDEMGAPVEETYEEPYSHPSCESWTATPASECPCCGGSMSPTTPTLKEAAEKKDYFGEPLGKMQPKAKQMVSNVHVLGFFPDNEGEGVTPQNITTWAEIGVEKMEWLERYWPNISTQVTQPASAEDIAEIFPTCEYDPTSKGSRGVNDRNVWSNHVIRREFHSADKTKAHPMGRSIIMVSTTSGNYVLLDGDYWIPGENKGDEDIPRVKYGIARCFLRDRELQGDGFPAMSRSAVRAINATTSQMIDRREHSLAVTLATKGMKLVREWVKNLAGMIFRWEPDPLAPGQKPEVIQTPMTDTSALNEIRYHDESIHADLGQNDAEIGSLKGVTNVPYSMYALAKESTSERREPRLEEGLEAIRVVLKHVLVLAHRYNREPRSYRVSVADGWEVREYLGTDLAGETNVEIEKEPFFDEKSARRDATAKEVELGHLQLTTRRAQREYFKAVGVDESVLEETNAQLERASRNYMVWLRTGKTPVPNPTLDDLDLHHQELGMLLAGDEGVEKAEEAKWDEVLAVISADSSGRVEWEVELEKLRLALPTIKKAGWKSGQPIFQQQPQPMMDANGQPMLDSFGQPVMGSAQSVNLIDQAAMQTYQEQVQQAQMMDQQLAQQGAMQAQAAGQPYLPPQPTQIPPPEPSGFVNQEPLKADLPSLILWVWVDLCLRVEVDTQEEKRRSYMAMCAVVEAYRLLSIAKTGVQPLEPGAAEQVPAAA